VLVSRVGSEPYAQLLALAEKAHTKEKHPSLFCLLISDEGKRFYNIATRGQWYKTFFFVTNEDTK
jgi:hypothetical protein